MNNDIVIPYIDYKMDIIEKYTDILLKYSLKKNVSLNKTIKLILDEYYSLYLSKSNYDIPNEFNISSEDELYNIMSAIIKCYDKHNIKYNSYNMRNKMLFLAKLINMAIILEKETRLPSDDIDYKGIINRIINNPLIIKNSRIELSSELDNIIKKDINTEKKFWKLIDQDSFVLSLKKINQKQFLVNGNYQLKILSRYANKDINVIAKQKDISDTLISIYLEQIQIIILKSILLGFDYTFYLSITNEYLSKKKNITNLENIISHDEIKKHLVLVLSFKDFKITEDIIRMQDMGFRLALNNLDDVILNDIELLGNIKILIASKSFLSNNRLYLDKWRKKKVRFIDPSKEFIEVDIEEILKGIRNE